MLKCETNTQAVHDEIESLVIHHFDPEDTAESFGIFFEHGQWFVRIEFYPDYDDKPERLYSVVDAEPGIINSGFDFEEL